MIQDTVYDYVYIDNCHGSLGVRFTSFINHLYWLILFFPFASLVIQTANLNIFFYSFTALDKLSILDLSDNDFSGGLPDVVGGLAALKSLALKNCALTSLPSR